MKKILTSILTLSMFFALTAAPKSTKNTVIEPISVKISADNLAENQATMQN